jgi:hypothetical protein
LQLFHKVQKNDGPRRYDSAAAILLPWQTSMTASVTKLLLTFQVKLTAVTVALEVLFFIIIIILSGVRLSPLGTAVAYCISPRWQVMVVVEQLVEWRLAREIEVFGENLPQRHFVHHKSPWPDLDSNPGRRGG